MATATPERHQIGVRQAAMAVLARAERRELEAAWQAWSDAPGVDVVRQPEFGLVMVRGRAGGGGAPFNLGEVTVTRTTVRLETGEVGVGHVLGREREKALLAAIFDALWQSKTHQGAVEAHVIEPVRTRLARERDLARRQTEATRVNFFTLVRGED